MGVAARVLLERWESLAISARLKALAKRSPGTGRPTGPRAIEEGGSTPWPGPY